MKDNENTTNSASLIAQLDELFKKSESVRIYSSDRNKFLHNCFSNKYLRLAITILPIILTSIWYFSLDIYRYFNSQYPRKLPNLQNLF